jgi:hypothetical protein
LRIFAIFPGPALECQHGGIDDGTAAGRMGLVAKHCSLADEVALPETGNGFLDLTYTVTMAAEGGQLQFNVMKRVIAFNIFQSLKMLTQAINTLTLRCIKGITANRERCRHLVEHSIGLVTALNPYIGSLVSQR